MTRIITIIILAMLIATQWSCSSSQSIDSIKSELQFVQFEKLEDLINQQPKPIVVFLHAEWCQFCRNMEQTTFKNQEVIETLNRDYYFVSFNGEQKEDVSFRGKTFKYQPNGRNSGLHELAQGLGTIDNSISYPTIAILNTEFEIVFQYGSFLDADELNEIL